MLEKDFSLDGIFIVFFFRLFLFSSPPLQFDWHGTAEEEMWVKGQHHPTVGPARLPRAASGHVLTLAKDQGCETETRSRRAAEQPRPAAGRRLVSGVIETEHAVQSSQSSRVFFPPLSPLPSVSCTRPSVDGDERSLPGLRNCLRRPFLVSKQVVLFSILVSTETAIICPLKRSHTQTGAHKHFGGGGGAGKACQRNS